MNTTDEIGKMRQFQMNDLRLVNYPKYFHKSPDNQEGAIGAFPHL